MVRYDDESISISVDSLIHSKNTGLAVFPPRTPRLKAGDRFEYEEEGTVYLLDAIEWLPSPNVYVRRRMRRRDPNHWLRVKLIAIADLYVSDPFPDYPRFPGMDS